jgi:hypothetical protein
VSQSTKSRRPVAILSLIAVVIAAVAITVAVTRTGGRAIAPSCRVAVGGATYPLDVDQAANATTIAAIGNGLGLPDHAVTIALATALQESKLHNVAHGDLDSVGLFQQRPSQGWGTPSQLIDPRYAATAFYQRLAMITGWQTLAVTDAAQQVQRSAAPDAYAGWEAEARALAQAMTGEVAAGLACRFPPPHTAATTNPTRAPTMTQVMAQELGSGALGTTLSPARGWTVATWLVGHAVQFEIVSVAFAGRQWTPSAWTWDQSSSAAPGAAQVQVRQAGAAGAA